MPSSSKEKAPELFEYKISFKLDQRATIAQRHYLAHNARDALGMFAYAMLKSLFNRKNLLKKDFISANEFVQIHDKSLQSPKFQLNTDSDLTGPKKVLKPIKESNQKTSISVSNVAQEMNQRIELIKLEEFNRWAQKWYSLKLPLEEIAPEDNH